MVCSMPAPATGMAVRERLRLASLVETEPGTSSSAGSSAVRERLRPVIGCGPGSQAPFSAAGETGSASESDPMLSGRVASTGGASSASSIGWSVKVGGATGVGGPEGRPATRRRRGCDCDTSSDAVSTVTSSMRLHSTGAGGRRNRWREPARVSGKQRRTSSPHKVCRASQPASASPPRSTPARAGRGPAAPM